MMGFVRLPLNARLLEADDARALLEAGRRVLVVDGRVVEQVACEPVEVLGSPWVLVGRDVDMLLVRREELREVQPVKRVRKR